MFSRQIPDTLLSTRPEALEQLLSADSPDRQSPQACRDAFRPERDRSWQYVLLDYSLLIRYDSPEGKAVTYELQVKPDEYFVSIHAVPNEKLLEWKDQLEKVKAS